MRAVAPIAMLSTLLASSLAAAQSKFEYNPGSGIAVPKRAAIPDRGSKAERGRIALLQFARCTIDRSPRQVTAALSMPLGPDYYSALGRLASDDCLSSGELRFHPILLRGALFAELWSRRAEASKKGRSWGPVLPTYDLNATIDSSSLEVARQQMLLRFADCVIKRDRSAVDDVVRLPVGSKEQAAAYVRLRPHLGTCLQQGSQIVFSKSNLQGILAEALYRAPTADVTDAGAK